MPRSFVAFLLLSCFGILFAGCAPAEDVTPLDEFSFTEDDLADVSRMVNGSGSSLPTLGLSGALVQTPESSGVVVLDAAKQRQYDALRSGVTSSGGNLYRVTNDFLNVRAAMSVGSEQIARLERGDALEVIDIPNAAWAKVRVSGNREGFVSYRYIAKVTTEEKLAKEKEAFKGKYFVNFQFLNVRKEPSQQSERLGELPSYAIVIPLNVGPEWARIPFEGREGYVSSQYLEPFEPSFLVRQEQYNLPVLHYRMNDAAALANLSAHITAMKAAGKRLVTLTYLRDLVLEQQIRDARVTPNNVVLVLSGVTPANVKEISDTLLSLGAGATIFLETKNVGLSGITEKTILTLMANGNDVQPAGHTGDDLRALTDSQARLELQQSKKLIEELTHKEAYAIAYPVGGVNDRIEKLASEAGFLFGVGQVPEKSFQRTMFLHLPSIVVGSGLSKEDVLKLVQ